MLALALFFSDTFYLASVLHRVQNGFAFFLAVMLFKRLAYFETFFC